jgi:molecular chaperone GrpE
MAEETEERPNMQRSDLTGTQPNNKLEESAMGGEEPTATKSEGLPDDAASASGAKAPAPAEAEQAPKGEERNARMNAAKAFYRAMYAGEDVMPDDFGMGGGGRVEGARTCGNCESLQQQMSQTEARASEVENLYKRMAADFDNFRKRTEREREELLGLGVQRAIETLLPAVDDLDRAHSSFTAESDSRSVLDSLKLIYNRFTKCFEQMGVKPMEVIGQPFDPKFHEPVQQVETNEQPDGAIVHDLRRGYLMRDKVIRPSLVNVAVNPSGVVAPKQSAAPQASTAKEPAVDQVENKEKEAVTKETVAKETVATEPVAKEPVAKEPVANEPVAKESVAKEPVAKEPVAKEPVAKEPVAKEPVAKEPVAKEPVAKEPVAKEPVVKEQVAKEPVAKEPITKETIARASASPHPDIASATAEIPILDTMISASELTLRTTHSQGEVDNVKRGGDEHSQSAHKQAAAKGAENSDGESEDKKGGDPSAELAEMSAPERQTSDE